MKLVTDYLRELLHETRTSWNRFWFTPQDPATLGLIRLCAGTMLFYTHFVWTLDLDAFFGAESWLNGAIVGGEQRGGYAWSHLWLCTSPWALWSAHILALVVFAMFAAGLFTRPVAIAAYLLTVGYVNRVPQALFGLDQINGFLAMYLMIGPSGDAFSLDRWLARRRTGGRLQRARPSISANIAIRLIQLHLCVLYFFAGTSKLMGNAWWNGTALWGAVANLEYQSIDMTWLAHYPILVNVMTHVSVLWEVTYFATVWPRMTRPIVIALAVPLHLGIAFCLGLCTFGLVMLIANMAFVSPQLVRALTERPTPTPAAPQHPGVQPPHAVPASHFATGAKNASRAARRARRVS